MAFGDHKIEKKNKHSHCKIIWRIFKKVDRNDYQGKIELLKNARKDYLRNHGTTEHLKV